jgi:hypothetical protein
MTTYHELLAALAGVGLVWLLVTALDWRGLLARPQVRCCAVCGVSDSVLVFEGGWCSPCRDRAAQAEQVRRERSRREYAAKLARWRAEDEAARLAARLPLLKAGSVYRDHAGQPVYDGFVFQGPADPGGKLPEILAHSGRHPRGALISGWKPGELHALAHGEACTCLD